MHRFGFYFFAILSFIIVSQNAIEAKKRNGTSSDDCNCVCGPSNRKERIVGGRKALEHEFPWIAMLSYAGTFYCGAALITPLHLLTAAHCVYGRKINELRVTLGEHDRSKDTDGKIEIRSIKQAKLHKAFDIAKIENDIAVLVLSKPVDVQGTNIRPACLPILVGRNYSGLDGIVAGWGRLSENGWTATTLRKVTVPLIGIKECSKMGYPAKRITGDVFCAGSPKGKKDACQGDSGGPMHLNGTAGGQMEVIGVVSWGRGCGRVNYPGVYTRVDRYMDWIQDQIDGECLCGHPSLHQSESNHKTNRNKDRKEPARGHTLLSWG